MTTPVSFDAIATFTAARDELFGTDALVGSAELARAVCRGAHQSVSIMSISAERMRRVDGWLDRHGLVTQATAASSSERVIGSLSDRSQAADIFTKVARAMVGDVPDEPLTGSETCEIGLLHSAGLPAGVDWFVLVFAGREPGSSLERGVGALAKSGRLACAEFSSVSAPVQFVGASPDDWNQLVASMVAAPTPSLSELLVDRGA